MMPYIMGTLCVCEVKHSASAIREALEGAVVSIANPDFNLTMATKLQEISFTG